jgi:lipopolysaccharide export system protein LptC
VFPLMALALLSTLFLLSREVDPEAVIPFADKEIQDRLRDQQVTGPFYTGITANGDQIAFSAQSLKTSLSDKGVNRAELVDVALDLASGTHISLNATDGQFNLAQDHVELEGDVVITTSTGYRITSDLLSAQMTGLNLHSPGPVDADGPVGALSAGSMVLSSPRQGGPAQLIFTNGVKLIYTPKVTKE